MPDERVTVRERPILFSGPMVRAILDGRKTQTRRAVKGGVFSVGTMRVRPCPYGVPGDRLWVREKVRLSSAGAHFAVYDADDAVAPCDAWPWSRNFLPPMFMPWGMSRIRLEIVSVRVERLQEISVEDCIAEGLATRLRDHDARVSLRDQFATGWDTINGKRAPWDSNPWVWVIEFRRIDDAR